MHLWFSLYLPQLPLEVFSQTWSADSGTVVLEQDRVLAASPAARAAGVRPGMRRGGVLMLMPDARLHDRAAEREAEALHSVALALLQYTPQVALAEESVALLNVGASLKLFGGVRALCRRVRATLQALGFTGILGCAPTARGAWLLARGGGGRALSLESMARRVDRLPALLPPPARPFASWLEGIGCDDIAALRRLPRPGLQRRCGRALLDMLDAAYGSVPEMFPWVEPPTVFHAKIELFDRIEQAEGCLAAAGRLTQQLVGWLCSRQMAVERITIYLDHERGRSARPPSRVEVALSEPTWRDDHLMRLLREQFARVELEAPVIGLALEAAHLQPQAPPSESLFPEPGNSVEDQARLFDLLVARLGPENVLQATPRADYRPEVANRWIPLQEKLSEAQRAAGMPLDVQSLPRPTWLLPKPIALLVRDMRPFYTTPLRIVAGPERIEGAWWDEDAQARDYFIAEGGHSLYWIFRDRPSGVDDVEPRWYLHGMFG